MILVDASGTLLAVHIHSAGPAEVKLVQAILDASFSFDCPARLIGDKAYDSDRPDADLAEIGVKMIVPNCKNRKQKAQDGRPLQRHKRHWKVERTITWLQSFRRVRTHDEHKTQHFLDLV